MGFLLRAQRRPFDANRIDMRQCDRHVGGWHSRVIQGSFELCCRGDGDTDAGTDAECGPPPTRGRTAIGDASNAVYLDDSATGTLARCRKAGRRWARDLERSSERALNATR